MFAPEALDGMVGSANLLSTFDVESIAPEALLFQTGYLTIQATESRGGRTRYRLGYPNKYRALGGTRASGRCGVQQRVAQPGGVRSRCRLTRYGGQVRRPDCLQVADRSSLPARAILSAPRVPRGGIPMTTDARSVSGWNVGASDVLVTLSLAECGDLGLGVRRFADRLRKHRNHARQGGSASPQVNAAGPAIGRLVRPVASRTNL